MSSGIFHRGGRALVWALAAVGLVAVAGGTWFVAGGVAARPKPPELEERAARAVRHLLIPAAARRTPNPVAATPAALAAGRAHFADHCATCHGNDGMGATRFGVRLSPRAPDLSDTPTQQLSDGELFWIIENGVRLTGMPAFGDDDPATDAESWHLVHFIRHLPEITPAELEEMKRLNPTLSRAEVDEERKAERFLAGADAPKASDRH